MKPEVRWSIVKRDYLNNMPHKQICEKHKITTKQLSNHIYQQKWALTKKRIDKKVEHNYIYRSKVDIDKAKQRVIEKALNKLESILDSNEIQNKEQINAIAKAFSLIERTENGLQDGLRAGGLNIQVFTSKEEK